MQILGQGHYGIVVGGEPGTVQKLYSTKSEWESEKFSLEFLTHMQDSGFKPNYIIPQLLNSAEGTWIINNKRYAFCNTMQRILGTPADSGITAQNLESFGRALGELLSDLHGHAKRFMPQFQKNTRNEHTLLRHIIDDKFGKVKTDTSQENDNQVQKWAGEAAEYLERRLPQLADELTLSHPDLSLSNILINENGKINGLVDWGFFGLTHPSLSLYQLVTDPDLWDHIQKQYRASGGAIRDDIVYAASTIHLAWAPIICRELGEALDEYETKARFNEVYDKFKSCKN